MFGAFSEIVDGKNLKLTRQGISVHQTDTGLSGKCLVFFAAFPKRAEMKQSSVESWIIMLQVFWRSGLRWWIPLANLTAIHSSLHFSISSQNVNERNTLYLRGSYQSLPSLSGHNRGFFYLGWAGFAALHTYSHPTLFVSGEVCEPSDREAYNFTSLCVHQILSCWVRDAYMQQDTMWLLIIWRLERLGSSLPNFFGNQHKDLFPSI